uniref:Exostosin GT47 domain-containing protein n=1 Tax=viral metagenome TaxID=1070528 RepID=A0A6C0ETV7_9ZZZZ
MEYISSRGFLKGCDFTSSNPISSIRRMAFYPSLDTINVKNPLIYVCNSAIPHFKNLTINFPFILVSGDSDDTMPLDFFTKEDFEKFINNPFLLHWFSQNMVIKHPKITLLPIGLDYHTMTCLNKWGPITSSENQEILIKSIKQKPFYERTIKCYANFHFQMNTKHSYDRKDAIEQISKDLIYYEPNHTFRLNSWNKQKDFAFVICPHGGGYDCHRLWEALILGCIPIVKKSLIDELYEELPVLILNEWSDLSQILLEETIITFKNKQFNYDKLKHNYWLTKMKDIQNKHLTFHL